MPRDPLRRGIAVYRSLAPQRTNCRAIVRVIMIDGINPGDRHAPPQVSGFCRFRAPANRIDRPDESYASAWIRELPQRGCAPAHCFGYVLRIGTLCPAFTDAGSSHF